MSNIPPVRTDGQDQMDALLLVRQVVAALLAAFKRSDPSRIVTYPIILILEKFQSLIEVTISNVNPLSGRVKNPTGEKNDR